MSEAADELEKREGYGGIQSLSPFKAEHTRQRHEFWIRLLYEHEIPSWFINHAQTALDLDIPKVLRSVQSGDFFYAEGRQIDFRSGLNLPREDAIAQGTPMLAKLAAILTCVVHPVNLLPSLERDGYTVDCNSMTLVPLDGPIKIQEEEDRFQQLINSVPFPNKAGILKHLTDATELFSTPGKEHSCLNESRNLLQLLIDDISEETNRLGGHSVGLPGGVKNRLEYLQKVGFFSLDEHAAFGSAWGALSAGSHPGVPPRDEARIGLILAIEFSQLLVLKFNAWSGSSCKNF